MQQSNVLDGSKSHVDLKHGNLPQEIIYHKSSSSSDIVIPEGSTEQKCDGIISHGASHDSANEICTSRTQRPASHMLHSYTEKIADKSKEALIPAKRPTVWGRTPAKKNLSMESIDLSSEDEKYKLEDKRRTDSVHQREEFLKQANIGQDCVKEEARSQESPTTKEFGNAMVIPTLKKEAQELSSSHSEWPSSIALNMLKVQSSEVVAKSLSSRTEETTSTTVPALAKLTNRLNLLRERRAKLANEMQNAQKNCTSAPVGSPQTGNS